MLVNLKKEKTIKEAALSVAVVVASLSVAVVVASLSVARNR